MADRSDPDLNASEATIGHKEVDVLKHLGLSGALDGEIEVTTAGLVETIVDPMANDAVCERRSISPQTLSRRLQRLEDGGLIDRRVGSASQRIQITAAGRRRLEGVYDEYRRVFEEPPEVTLGGSITTGLGEGGYYVTLAGYLTQFEAKLGYEPYAGTLNVELDEYSKRNRANLPALSSLSIEEWEEEGRVFGPADCYPATIETADDLEYDGGHVLVPERTHHEPDILEIIAPIYLRDELGIEDGDRVTVLVRGAES